LFRFIRELIAWTLLGVFLGGVFWIGDLVAGIPGDPGQLIWMGVVSTWIWALVRPLIQVFGRAFPFDGKPRFGRILLHLLASLLVGLLLALAMAYLFWQIMDLIGKPRPYAFMRAVTTQYFFLAEVLFYWIVILFGEARRYLTRWREDAVRLAETREQLTSARLAALRGQVRPHFLFNTFHALGAMIRTDAKRDALDTIVELGDLLRASLSEEEDEVWPLSREIELARKYLQIEQRRFVDRMTVAIEVEEGTAGVPVPRFLLQPLVENAVRHGIEADDHAREIRLAVARDGDALRIVVTNQGPAPRPDWRHRAAQRVGLQNLKARLKHRYGGAASLALEPGATGGAVVTLTIPLEAPCPG